MKTIKHMIVKHFCSLLETVALWY